jgi:multicomponent Na+:H+ antiporter subunit A
VSLAPAIEAGHTIVDRVAWAPSLGVDFTLRVDGFSLLFALLITGIGTLVIAYAGAYMSEESVAARARFFTQLLLFMTAMLGAVFSDNLLVFYFFWESTSILSFLLIGFHAESPHARRAALMSLRITAGGGLALLGAIILIGITLDSYSMVEAIARAGELAASRWSGLIVGGVLLGVFTKSAQFPFHFWLPNAMQAPTPASAYLHSATMVKLGIYLLARFEPLVGAVPGVREIVVGVAVVTMLIAAFKALRAENFKSVLAYSTVASLGILVMLIGLHGPTATVAMVGFILAHALYKAALFFVAGTVQHATGLSKLRMMGGLGRFLPVTALAAVLASLSMAGLPPFLGFITKEFLVQAQLESAWDLTPLAAAVIVNSVMVAVAGIVTLRPFFLGRRRVKEVRHRETPGLLLGPLLLALLGLFISLDPDWLERAVLGPAVTAVYGAPVEVETTLWHGLTPMLALSVVAVGIGVLIYIYWTPIHVHLRSLTLLRRYSLDRGYESILRWGEALAGATARLVQRGELRSYLWVVIATASVFVVWGLAVAGQAIRLPDSGSIGAFRIGSAAVALIGLAGGIAAARARTLLSSMIAVGLVGFVSALIFMMNGAPDLALTQFAVEALIVVLLTAALLTVPLRRPPTRSLRERVVDGALSVVVAALIFIVLVDMVSAPAQTAISDFYGEQSYLEAFGRNVVNVILVDFRAFDTLGETTVIALSAIFAWSLLGPRTAREKRIAAASRQTAFILTFTSRLFFWLLAIVSVVTLLRGHNEIGGGFVGGLVAALAFAMIALAEGVERARTMLRVHPLGLAGGGLLLAVISGLPGLFVHGAYLSHVWLEASIFGIEIKQGTPLLFDIGVYTVVLGGILAFLFGLQREAER